LAVDGVVNFKFRLLYTWERTLVSFEWEVARTQGSSWTFWRRENLLLSELFFMAFSLGDDVQWVTGLNLRDVLGRNALKLEALKKLVTRLSKPHARISVNKKYTYFASIPVLATKLIIR
jgi:hypothetical protein